MFRVEFTTRHTTVHYQGFPVVHLWKTREKHLDNTAFRGFPLLVYPQILRRKQ